MQEKLEQLRFEIGAQRAEWHSEVVGVGLEVCCGVETGNIIRFLWMI